MKQQTLKQQDILMMQSPNEWPRWPLLPVKKWNDTNKVFDCGIMFADSRPRIICTGLFSLDEVEGKTYGEKFANFPQLEFGSFEEIIAAGWRVD